MYSTKETMLDIDEIMNGYLNHSDWRVNENANVNFSLGGLILHNSGTITANYWLKNIYTPEIAEAHRTAAFHIHDLSMLSGYCAGWSLRQLIIEGLGGVPDKITSTPASHLSTLVNQIVNFFGVMQNEWAGAQAFSSFDTYLAPFVRKDNLSEKQVRQCIQSFIYGVNTPSRWGSQAPFTNITLDWVVPDDLKNKKAIVGGKEQDFTYGDCQHEMDIINKVFIELMIEGDAGGRGFQYPIPTYNITKDFNWDSDNARLLFEMTARYGTPYFQNFVNSELNPGDVRSMCILPDTNIRIKEIANGHLHNMPIKEVFDAFAQDEYLILTRFGYKPVKEEFEFKYKGDMVKVTTESGITLTTTLDHPWRVYCDNMHNLYEKKAIELKVGDYVSVRTENALSKYNRSKKGKSYEEFYGEERGSQIRKDKSEISKKSSLFCTNKNPALNMTQEQKDAISKGCKCHYVSENCRQKSSERWKEHNPVFNQEYWDRNHKNSAITSKYELMFAEELEALGLDYVHQYVVKGHIVDFYIHSKNLIVELETHYDGCSYNEEHGWRGHHGVSGADRLKELMDEGYNVLIFNPTDGSDEYRKYINKADKIVSIEIIPYDGYVYDVEIDTYGSYLTAHTFYANDILTGNCCRLQLDKRELRKRGGGLFGSDEFTGSIGVVTINLPQIGYLTKNKEEFYERLYYLMDLAKDSLLLKRKIINKLLEKGLFPYTKRYLSSFKNHFNTIGLCGMNECCLNFLGVDIVNQKGKEFAEEILNNMRDKISDYQEETGELFNLEATPAESTSYRLAYHDKQRYPDIITSGTEEPFYTNSTQLPVDYTNDIFEALDHQESLQTKYTGGTVFHTFMGESIKDWHVCRDLVRTITANYRIPYLTVSPTFSICRIHGYLNGEQFECPKCKAETEQKLRIHLAELEEEREMIIKESGEV